MATDHFCLKWNNFHNSLVSAFESLQSSEDLVDVTLMCEGRNVKAHKVILSACSPYFRNLFKETPCQHPIIILKDVLHCDLLAILQFMYQGEVLITQDGLSSFLKTAELLQVSGLAGNTPQSPTPLKEDSTTVPTQSSQATPPSLVSLPIASPSSPRSVSNKHHSEASVINTRQNKESTAEKETSEKQRSNKLESESEPVQSCSYQPDTVVVKTESDDLDYEDMDYKLIDEEMDDESGPAAEEQQSILERSLKAQGMSPHSSKLYTMDLSIGPQFSTIPSPNQSTLSPHPELMNNPCVTPLVLVTKNNTELKDSGKRKIKTVIEPIPSTKKILVKSIMPKVDLKNKDNKSEPSPPRGEVSHGAQFGKCPHCTKVYSNQSALKYHVRLVHSDMLNMFCCHLCPESFEYRESYKTHMWDKHNVRN